METPSFIYHYYEIEQGPFKNITEHGFDKAVEIQQDIKIGLNSQRPSNYIELRFALENRLKKKFIDKGGKPNRNDPFYFTLNECEWLKSTFKNPGVIKIPLNELKPDQISFTYPDSMVSFQFHDEPKLSLYRKEYNGQVFLLNELEALISKYGLPSEDLWKSQKNMKYDRYIEAQVWDDSIIKKHK